MLAEKDLQAIDELIARRLGVVVESDIKPKFDLLVEGQQTILENLVPKSRVDTLEEELDLLKAAFRGLSREVSELKKAQ